MKPKIYKTLLLFVFSLLVGCSDTWTTTGGRGSDGSNGSSNTYIIHFETQGGDYCESKSGYYGEEIKLPPTYKSGYYFWGWYNSTSGGNNCGMNGDTYKITSNTTLYARWETSPLQKCKISFDSQVGTYCKDTIVNLGDKIYLPNTTQKDFTFDGWYSAPYGRGNYYGKAGDYFIVNFDNSNVTLYANWIYGCSNLSAPTGIYANASSENSIKVSWTSVSAADYYEVYWSDKSSGHYIMIEKTNSTSYTDYSPHWIIPGNTNYYKVKAVNSCGESSFSNIASAMTYGGIGMLVIDNISSFNLVEVFINSDDYGSISRYSKKSYNLKSGTHFIEAIDDYGNGEYFFSFVNISSGQTTTLVFAYNGFQ
jgi:hypothetical protein